MPKNILIIDDNSDDLEFYKDLLEHSQEDYAVFTAESGEEALEISASQNIYCTFVDYYLPEMNGVKILEALHVQSKGKMLPVVILTGEPHQTIQAEAARKGALDYIVKDVANTTEQMSDVIEKVVGWAHDLNKK